MWTLKEQTITRPTQEEVQAQGLPPGRLLQLEQSMVFTNGTHDIAVSTFISTEAEAQASIDQNLKRLNDQEVLEAKVAAGSFTATQEVVEKTAEEIAAENAKEAAAAAKAAWQSRRAALKQMREDMMEAKDLGVEPSAEQVATMKALAEWVRDNATEEFYS